MFDLKLYSGKKFGIISPYLTCGTGVFGFAHNRIINDTYVLDKKDNNGIGVKTGVGFNLSFNGQKSVHDISGLYMEINYILGFTKYEKTSYIPVMIGFRVNK
ncbi:MAG: hypothetical protein GY863_20050 [bacterium]|nr:hypothetical protein [bacterium]